MSRRKAAAARARRRGPVAAREVLVEKRDGSFWVRALTGATSTKEYRCPGCDQLIAMATPHVVVWPEHRSMFSESNLDDRRHWHTACWNRSN